MRGGKRHGDAPTQELAVPRELEVCAAVGRNGRGDDINAAPGKRRHAGERSKRSKGDPAVSADVVCKEGVPGEIGWGRVESDCTSGAERGDERQ